jgi:hypothetical protein
VCNLVSFTCFEALTGRPTCAHDPAYIIEIATPTARSMATVVAWTAGEISAAFAVAKLVKHTNRWPPSETGSERLDVAVCSFSQNLKLGQDKRLDSFFAGQPQAQQTALTFKIDMKIEERAALAFRSHPL